MALRQAFKLYAKQRATLAPGSLIPEVMVPFENLDIHFTNDEIQKAKLAKIESQILNHNKQFECYGFKYFPNVLNEADEVLLIDHTIDYIREVGCRVEDEHLIQIADRGLSHLHPTIQKMQREFIQHANLKDSEVKMSPNFNYYPFPNSKLHAHQDNLFLADQIAVITAGFSGSVRPLCFRNWCSGFAFTVYVQSRSMFIMDKFSRYDFTHGGDIIEPITQEELEIRNIFQECRGQRLSYVLGANVTNLEIANSVQQVWGESDQRAIVDQFFKFQNPSSLVEYLDYVLILAEKMKDFNILKNAIAHVKKRYHTFEQSQLQCTKQKKESENRKKHSLK